MTTLAASTAGALINPAARNFMLGSVEHDWLAGELDLDQIEPDNHTVHLKSGAIFRAFKLQGVSYDAKERIEQDAMLKVRSSLFHYIGELGCSIRVFGIKRLRDISFDAEWPSKTLKEIGDAERSLFQSSYYIDWYLLVSSSSVSSVIEADKKIMSMLGDYKPERLERPKDKNAVCPLTGFMNFLVCGELRNDLLAVSENISGNIPGSDLGIDNESGIIKTFTPTCKLSQVIAIRTWPEVVNGKILSDILTIPGELEVSQICVPWDRDAAKTLLGRKENEQRNRFFGNSTLANECKATRQLLSEGNTTLFHTQLQIIVRAANQEELNSIIHKVCDILGRLRIAHNVETAGAPVCWFNRLPTGVGKINGASGLLRPLTLRNDNIAALWSFQHSPVGMTSSPYGDLPIRNFLTPSGQAYAFQFHVKAKKTSIGNYLVFA
ncbi:MAG: type IV secretion system protein B4, partial [Rhodospirillales bacterium]|nr:type IV secretion system protein B4 [Rhodospirillales bacterium]